MKSFELPIDQWRSIENALSSPLGEIDAYRNGFLESETQLTNAVQRLRQLDLGAPFDCVVPAIESGFLPVPQAESLAFDKRHATGSTAADYGTMRHRIERDHKNMPLTSDVLREIHRNAVGTDAPGAGQWKAGKNFFPIFDAEGNWVAARTTSSTDDIPADMARLHDALHEAMAANTIDPLLWIAAYALDVFAIHPFQDGNGRVTRLAMQLLLFQFGHFVARRISVEGMVSKRRSAYTETIIRSYDQWSAARHDPTPWCRFVVALVLDAYREFSMRTAALDALADHAISLRNAIEQMPKTFRTVDLTRHSPECPEAITAILLNNMRRRGQLRASATGNDVRWFKDTSQPGSTT